MASGLRCGGLLVTDPSSTSRTKPGAKWQMPFSLSALPPNTSSRLTSCDLAAASGFPGGWVAPSSSLGGSPHHVLPSVCVSQGCPFLTSLHQRRTTALTVWDAEPGA